MKIATPLIALFGLLLAACAPVKPEAPAPVPAEAHPALWKLSDADTTIYLFGTIHVLPAGYKWENQPIRDAVKSADALVIEAIIDPDPAKSGAILMGLGLKAGLPPLAERVAAGKRAALTAMVARSGFPAATLDGMKTWAASLMLMGVTLRDLALDPSSGVEEDLEAQFRAAGKPISGLETAEQQLGYFNGLSEKAQREFLVTLLDDPAKARQEFADMLAAWAKGDEKAITATFDSDMEMSPEMRDALLRQRNARWAKALGERLARPGTIFVAVGAGHLAGPGSVPALLKAKGFAVERVQ